MEGEIMRFMNLVRYRRSRWIIMHIEKYDEDDITVWYKYLTDSDDLNTAGKIEINKDVEFIITDNLYSKLRIIEDYFVNGMIKIISCPLNITDKTKGFKDYNAVYTARTVVEKYFLTGLLDDDFTILAFDYFQKYLKKYTDFLMQ